MFKAAHDMNLLAIASSLGLGGVGRSHDRASSRSKHLLGVTV